MMTRPPTNKDNNDLASFDQTSRLQSDRHGRSAAFSNSMAILADAATKQLEGSAAAAAKTPPKVKKAPYHSRRGGLNGSNLFKQHKKYCIVKREITLDDFVENFFAYAREIRCRSVCKSDVALAQGLARAGPRGINARLLEMWKELSPEQRQEYNARASDIKTRTAIILRDKHKVRQKG